MRRGLLLIVLLVLAAPHSALAGTVSVGDVPADPKYGYTSRALFFAAAPGERNRIVVSAAGDSGSPRFVLHDAGAPVTVAAADCTTIDERTVSCPASSVFVDAGDGDDEVTLPSAGRDGYVRGGDGSDVLTGGGFLTGGPGNDALACPGACTGSVLAGGAGDDILRGSSGNDLLSGDGDGPAHPIGFTTVLTESGVTGNDVIDGGPGTDQLTFRGRATGVTVDLAAGNSAGAGTERDTLTGIEDVAGGAGDDLLLGDAGVNRLEGESGNDRISGRDGDDHLLGNLVPDTNEYSVTYTQPDPGADTLRGGEGDDTLDAGSERGDILSGGPGADTLQDGVGGPTRVGKVRCGSGRDTIEFAPQGQLLSDCELLIGGGLRIAPRPRFRAGGRLGFVWRCYRGGRCGVAAAVRVRSSRPMNRTVVFRGTRELVFRPRRPARRGDVVDITAVVSTGNPPLYAARWRVEL